MSMLENSRRIVVKVGTSTLTHATGALQRYPPSFTLPLGRHSAVISTVRSVPNSLVKV